jgi:hypothetical protein
MKHTDLDIDSDLELRAALRSVEAEPPVGQVDWDALRTSIVSRAELPMARRRARSARLPRWGRPLVPFAVAASIVLALWFHGFSPQPDLGTPIADGAPAFTVPFLSAEDLFHADLTDQEFQHLVSGRAHSDALLLVAVGGS